MSPIRRGSFVRHDAALTDSGRTGSVGRFGFAGDKVLRIKVPFGRHGAEWDFCNHPQSRVGGEGGVPARARHANLQTLRALTYAEGLLLLFCSVDGIL